MFGFSEIVMRLIIRKDLQWTRYDLAERVAECRRELTADAPPADWQDISIICRLVYLTPSPMASAS
jgi:hypothetical protein